MEYIELLEKLDLEGPEEFKYFENFADLIESEDRFGEESLAELFSMVEKDIVAEIVENYFNEVLDVLQEQGEIYTTVELIKNMLIRLLNEDGIRDFARELDGVHSWYTEIYEVEVTDYTNSGSMEMVSILDAVANLRYEKLGGIKCDYDFYNVMDYEIEEYVVNINFQSDEPTENKEEYVFEEDFERADEEFNDEIILNLVDESIEGYNE